MSGFNDDPREPRSPVGVEEPLFPERPPDDDDLRGYEPVQPSSGLRDLLRKIFAPVLVGLGLIAKFGIFSLKFFGIFLAVGGYALIWGWRFAIGFVLLILVHEMGHFVEARLQGFRPSLPVFIPFIGAYVAIKDASPDPWLYAKRALAGPIAGGLASAVCYAVAVQNGSDLLSALAYVGFFLNLFNLIPIGILDGGAIWRSYKFMRLQGDPRAALVLALYIGTAAMLVLGMWVSHVPQNRL
ncbi:MAG TPA: site-2 protease family protein [Gaiellaceae bacterium]|nr:site-2 protease family protein [Gaiellaceae bacterium]